MYTSVDPFVDSIQFICLAGHEFLRIFLRIDIESANGLTNLRNELLKYLILAYFLIHYSLPRVAVSNYFKYETYLI